MATKPKQGLLLKRLYCFQVTPCNRVIVTWGRRSGEAERKCLQDEIPSQTDIDQNVLLLFWIIGHVDCGNTWFKKNARV